MKSVKGFIMLILSLLVALFMAGMGVLSTLNLRHAQGALSELRVSQIEEIFHANLGRIEARHRLMEKNAEALARMGEVLYRARLTEGPNWHANFEKSLLKKIGDSPEASGGGLWFESSPTGGSTAPAAYAAWSKHGVRLIPEYSAPGYNHARQPWYRAAHTSLADTAHPSDEPFHWSTTYYDAIQQDALVTVAAPMRDRGRFIGLATTSWRAGDIIRQLDGVKVTPGSFAFLIDRNNRKLTSLSLNSGSPGSETVLAALTIEGVTGLPWSAGQYLDGILRAPLHTRPLEAGGRQYSLYLSRTRAGMLFGIGVPQDEIDSVLEPMRATNYRVGIITGLVMLVLSGIILLAVASILRLLETLYTDPLTHLPNRARLLRDTNSPGSESLILVNIDDFKEINDFYGLQCGDHILCCLAEALQAFLDGHGHPATLYRLPGDEFALLIRSALPQDALEVYLQALSDYARSRTFHWEDHEISLSVTLGAASASYGLPHPGISNDALVSSANIALKLARRERRHYLVYDTTLTLRQEYEQNLLWAERLKSALREDRIVPHFQPIVSNKTGRGGKYECLVRLLDEQGQAVSPALFLGIAKKLRLYREITRIMVDKSIATFRGTPCEFSLNLSYEDLADADTTTYIIDRVRAAGVAHQVTFEILESEGIQNYQQVKRFIDEVKAMGCHIAIDDFGTGHSNFEHLLRLDADIIKLDGCLVRNLDRDPTAVIVARSIVRFAHELGIHTVAEFVHCAAVQEQVATLGIDYSQGALFGMPAPAIDGVSRYALPLQGTPTDRDLLPGGEEARGTGANSPLLPQPAN